MGLEPIEAGQVPQLEVEQGQQGDEEGQPGVAGAGHDADTGGGEDGRRRRDAADHALAAPEHETGTDEADAGHHPADCLRCRADRHGRDGGGRRADQREGPVSGRSAPQRPFEADGVAEEERQPARPKRTRSSWLTGCTA